MKLINYTKRRLSMNVNVAHVINYSNPEGTDLRIVLGNN